MTHDFASVPPAVSCSWCGALMHPGSMPESLSICGACETEHFKSTRLRWSSMSAWRILPILLLIPSFMLALERAIEGVA